MTPATSDSLTQAERLRRIDALAGAIRSRARDLDERAAFPTETFAELRAAGLLALTAPVDFGGAGLWSEGNYRPYYELLETLSRIDSVTAQLLQVHSHALGIVSALSSDEQRRRLLPDIVAAGKLLASVGSEAKPSGKLADIARTELRGDCRRHLPADLPEVLRVVVVGRRRADDLDRGSGCRPVHRAEHHRARPEHRPRGGSD